MKEEKQQTIRLYPNSLLSKWGFRDGDVLEDILWDNDLAYKVNEHKLLLTLVKKYLLPKLNHKVEVCFVETNHNPIRAEMIDGVEYSNWYEDDEWDNKLTPEYVEIDYSTVLEEARKMIK